MRIDLHNNDVTSCDLFLDWWRWSLSDDLMKCRLILISSSSLDDCIHLLKKILLFNFKNWNINSYSIRSCDQVRSFWKSKFDEFLRSLRFRVSSDFAPYISVSGCDSTILLTRKEIKRSELQSKNPTIKGRFRKTKKYIDKKITNQFVSSWATRLPYWWTTLGRFFCPIEKYETYSRRNPDLSMKRIDHNQITEYQILSTTLTK